MRQIAVGSSACVDALAGLLRAGYDPRMTDEPENLILHQLRALDAKLDAMRAEFKADIKALRDELQASDAETSSILGALLKDSGQVKSAILEFFVEIGRLKKRVERVEERPGAQ